MFGWSKHTLKLQENTEREQTWLNGSWREKYPFLVVGDSSSEWKLISMHKAVNVDRQYVKAGTKEITRVKDFFEYFRRREWNWWGCVETLSRPEIENLANIFYNLSKEPW